MNEFGNCYLSYLLRDASLQSTYQRLEEVKGAKRAKKAKRAPKAARPRQ